MNLEDQISKMIHANNATLYDIETVSEGDQTIFRVYVIKDEGISLDKCAEISRELSVLLDVNPPVNKAYTLEVSSPGLERKLSKPKHFKCSIGEKIKFKVINAGKNKGLLVEADDNGITIKTKDEIKNYSYDQLITAKTYINWS